MDTSFSLSLELIYLMDWLLKHEKSKLRELINSALKKGLLEELNQFDYNIENFNNDDINDNNNETDSTELHTTILDFLIYLEDTLIESLNKKDAETDNLEKINLKPEIRKINSGKIDAQTLLISVQQAKTLYLKNKHSATKQQDQEIKNVLYSQLIKNWKPGSNDLLN